MKKAATPKAELTQVRIDFDDGEATLDNTLAIRCYSCNAWNGTVTFAMPGGVTIGKSVRLHEALVNKGKPKDGLPRYGLRHRTLQGKGRRGTRRDIAMRFGTPVRTPVWMHCVECNRGQLVDVVLRAD